jgi:ABC-type phosphate/phosphonate transport system substrate-binding protein
MRLLAGKVRLSKIEFTVQKGTTPGDLLNRFGGQLDRGDFHLGIVWGVEYGWLLKKYPKLKPLAVVSVGGTNVPTRSQLMVRRADQKGGLKALKGKKLARFQSAPLMDRLALDEILKQAQLDPKGFFTKEGKPFGNVRQAILAVKNGQADCIVVNAATLSRLREAQPNLYKDLVPIGKVSDVFPLAVFVGIPRAVNRLQPRVSDSQSTLWKRLQQELVTIHETPRGKQVVKFWKIRSFIKPDDAFEKQVRKCVQKYPVDRLLTLKD